MHGAHITLGLPEKVMVAVLCTGHKAPTGAAKQPIEPLSTGQ